MSSAMNTRAVLVPVSLGYCEDWASSCSQKAQPYLERSRVGWCQWRRLLCSLHSNVMSDLVFINIPQENAHQISGHVTPSHWAWFLICQARWSDYKGWPWRPPRFSIITQSSGNHCREMTYGNFQPRSRRKDPAKAWGLVHISFSFHPDKQLTFVQWPSF